APLDLAKDGQAEADKQLNISLQPGWQPFHQRQAPVKKVSRALDFKAHELHKRGRTTPLLQVGVAIAKPFSIFRRNVDAVDVQVASDILPEIGKLQTGANTVCKCGVLGVIGLAKIKHQMSDRISGIMTVTQE